MLRTWSETLETLDATTGTRVFQKVKFENNVVLYACRINIIAFNNPTFTDISMDIYSLNNLNTPVKLLHQSTNAITKVEMMTENNGVYDIPLFFNYPTFKGGDYYAFIPRVSGYTFSDNSFLSWRKDFPDPVYKTNNPYSTLESVGRVSYSIQFVGAEL